MGAGPKLAFLLGGVVFLASALWMCTRGDSRSFGVDLEVVRCGSPVPVPGAVVLLELPEGYAEPRARGTTGADGRVRLSTDDPPETTFTVTARKDGFLKRTRTLHGSADSPFQVCLQPTPETLRTSDWEPGEPPFIIRAGCLSCSTMIACTLSWAERCLSCKGGTDSESLGRLFEEASRAKQVDGLLTEDTILRVEILDRVHKNSIHVDFPLNLYFNRRRIDLGEGFFARLRAEVGRDLVTRDLCRHHSRKQRDCRDWCNEVFGAPMPEDPQGPAGFRLFSPAGGSP